MEIYIDDVVVKSKGHQEHLADLRRALECTRRHGLKMNPNKCGFGVSAGQFLGFMVHERGIEISHRLPPTKWIRISRSVTEAIPWRLCWRSRSRSPPRPPLRRPWTCNTGDHCDPSAHAPPIETHSAAATAHRRLAAPAPSTKKKFRSH